MLEATFTQCSDSFCVHYVCDRYWTPAGGGFSLRCGYVCVSAALRLSPALSPCCGCALSSCSSPLPRSCASSPCFDSGSTVWPSSPLCASPCRLCASCPQSLPCSFCPWTSPSRRLYLYGAPCPSSCSCPPRRPSLCLYARSFAPDWHCDFSCALAVRGSCLRCGTAASPCPRGPLCPYPCPRGPPSPSPSSVGHAPSPALGQSWGRGVPFRGGGSCSLTVWVTSGGSASVWVSW